MSNPGTLRLVNSSDQFGGPVSDRSIGVWIGLELTRLFCIRTVENSLGNHKHSPLGHCQAISIGGYFSDGSIGFGRPNKVSLIRWMSGNFGGGGDLSENSSNGEMPSSQ